jgi:DNA-3-methyladenine glycosylase II
VRLPTPAITTRQFRTRLGAWHLDQSEYGEGMAFLAMPQPFDFELTTERFRVFGPDLANLWHEGGLHRVVDGREVRIEAAQKPPVARMNRATSEAASTSAAAGGIDVEPLDDESRAVALKLLGAEFDLADFTPDDPILAAQVERLRGLRPAIAPDPFEMLVGAITAQQISMFAAFAVRNRFIERFGARADLAHAFPTAERVAAAAPDELLALGFSRRKADYLLNLARSDLDFASLAELPDDEVKATLVRLPGIGEWTADWFLARHLARPHAWPAGDLALRYAVSSFYGDGRVLSIQETRELGPRFHPFQNLTAHYLLAANRNPA